MFPPWERASALQDLEGGGAGWGGSSMAGSQQMPLSWPLPGGEGSTRRLELLPPLPARVSFMGSSRGLEVDGCGGHRPLSALGRWHLPALQPSCAPAPSVPRFPLCEMCAGLSSAAFSSVVRGVASGSTSWCHRALLALVARWGAQAGLLCPCCTRAHPAAGRPGRWVGAWSHPGRTSESLPAPTGVTALSRSEGQVGIVARTALRVQ